MDLESADTTRYGTVIAELMRLSDRDAALWGAERIRSLLHQAIRKFFIPSNRERDELLDDGGPLGALPAMIDLAHRLGLIDLPFAQALHGVDTLRGEMAGAGDVTSLASEASSPKVEKLFSPLSSKAWVQALRKNTQERTGVAGPSLDFRVVLSLMVVALHLVVLHCKPLSPENAVPLYTENPGRP